MSSAVSNADVLYLSRAEMDRIGPSMAEIIDLLERAFQLKGQGRASMPAKHWITRSNERFYSAMSSYIAELGFAGCKWQSGDPLNSARGLPYIQGLYLLTEDTHGIPVAIFDAEWITGRRTAAASALAVKHLARPEAACLAMLGCGLQGRAHLEAVLAVRTLTEVRAFDVRRDVAERFAAELGARYAIAIKPVDSAEAAVRGADIVISGGPILNPPRPSIRADWLAAGMLGVSIDYDSYWTPEAMQSMSLIVTDDRSQLEHLTEYGLFLGVPQIHCELADVVVGRLPARQSPGDRVLCFNLGIAIEDLVTAVDLYRRAIATSAGTRLPR